MRKNIEILFSSVVSAGAARVHDLVRETVLYLSSVGLFSHGCIEQLVEAGEALEAETYSQESVAGDVAAIRSPCTVWEYIVGGEDI